MFILIHLGDWIRDQGGCSSVLEYVQQTKTSPTNWFSGKQPAKSEPSLLSKTSLSSTCASVMDQKTYAIMLLLVLVVPVVLSVLVYTVYSRQASF